MKRIVKCKSFRLIDFHPVDEVLSKYTSHSASESGSDDGSSPAVNIKRQFLIQLFGVNETGQTCAIIIDDFQPYFYVRLPRQWNDSEIREWTADLKHQLPKYVADALVSVTPLTWWRR